MVRNCIRLRLGIGGRDQTQRHFYSDQLGSLVTGISPQMVCCSAIPGNESHGYTDFFPDLAMAISQYLGTGD
jgi:hypothetical protein